MAQVTLKQVWKRYADVAAVKDVNIAIPDQSFYVLVGPSGCGKSTVLRMIAGLEDITQGEIYIGDRLVNGVQPKHRDIAMVFQNYALYPHMTSYENMAFGLKLRDIPKKEIDERVQEAADILGITSLLDRKPKSMSGGQRQRVAVGRAIVRKPQVFLFDEPLSNLDAKMRVHMRLELAKLHEKLKTTIIYVTHDQLEAMTLASHVAIMKDGTIQQVAPPLELYGTPANKFVAGFIGSPPMNFLKVKVLGKGEGKGEGLQVDLGQNGKAAPLLVSNGFRNSLKPYMGKTVIMGIRPEDIYDKVYYQGDGKGRTIKSKVDVVEPMGSEKFLYLTSAGNPVVARVNPDNKAYVNQNIDIVFHMEKAKFFDPDTENVIA